MEGPEASEHAPSVHAVSTKFYRPELDALRALAFLMVFLHHAHVGFMLSELHGHHGRLFELVSRAMIHTGDSLAFGVGLFFALSSYLISSLLLIEREKSGRINFRAFYVRRALRIWPLYFAFVLLCPVLGWIFPEMALPRAEVGTFLLFAGNWYIVLNGYNGSPILFLWSVCLEEQFYLLWPAVVAWRGRRSLLASCLVVFGIAAAALVVLGHMQVRATYAVWCNSLVQFLFFAAGGVLALLFRKRVPDLRLPVRASMVGSGIVLLALAEAATRISSARTLTAAPLLTGYAMSLAAVVLIFLGFLGLHARWVPNWLRYMGKISYGLYVFHMPCIGLTGKAVATLAGASHAGHAVLGAAKAGIPIAALAATVGVAHISYQYLEAPFLRIKERFTIVRSRAV